MSKKSFLLFAFMMLVVSKSSLILTMELYGSVDPLPNGKEIIEKVLGGTQEVISEAEVFIEENLAPVQEPVRPSTENNVVAQENVLQEKVEIVLNTSATDINAIQADTPEIVVEEQVVIEQDQNIQQAPAIEEQISTQNNGNLPTSLSADIKQQETEKTSVTSDTTSTIQNISEKSETILEKEVSGNTTESLSQQTTIQASVVTTQATGQEGAQKEEAPAAFFGITYDRETLLYFGAGAVALITVGGITYVLYKNGTLKKVGKELQKFVHEHKVGVATATLVTICAVVAGIYAKQQGVTFEQAYNWVSSFFKKNEATPSATPVVTTSAN